MRGMGAFRPALGCLIGLVACSESRFEFRGYTELSSCRQVIDAELANGAEFEDAYDSTDPELPGHITELDGRLFDLPVRIDVTCSPRGKVTSVQYVALARDPDETATAFGLVAAELSQLFGEPRFTTTADSRTLSYGCEDPAPVRLEEWILTEVEHEVYLAVVPGLMSCLAASVNSK